MNDVAANPGRVLNVRYTLHERLGVGGQGEVWRARDPQRDSDIALKVLHPAATRIAPAWEALQREYAINSRLDHPYILKVFAPEATEDALLLPMELASGGDLRRLRGADYLAIVPVLLEVAQALEHAHRHGVIHRDLKPGNVLLDARGAVKLADFGIAGTVLASGSDPARGVSPFTASPQQLRGEPPTPADDIYGLGALAYELLSGYPPHYPHFDLQKVQREPVPELAPAAQMPPQLGALIARMLQKDPALRPASMREVIDALDSALNDTLTFEFETAEPPREAAAPAERTGRHAALSVSPPAPSQVTVPEGFPAPGVVDGQSLWEEMRLNPTPALGRLEPMRSGRPNALIVVAVLAAAALAAFYWLPRHTGWPAAWVRADRAPVAAMPKDAAASSAAAASADEAALQAQRLTGVAPLIADGQNVLAAHQYSRAAQDYTQALQLDPKNAQARNGLAQAQAAVGDDNYARAAGEGFAALGAGRLAEARAAFERARSIQPNGPEALDGLRRVNAAAGGHGSAERPVGPAANATAGSASGAVDSLASMRSHAEQLEAQERWDEAAALYAAALREDGSLSFAQAGKARAGARARLDHALQALLDQPDRLESPEVRDQASALLDTAQATTPSGPVLRSQIARLQILLPDFDKPVPVSLVSDSVTQVSILSVGSFGNFERRDIQLKPGTYTVLGSRVGYRDVRREITVSPGETQTVSVSCYDPI